MVNFAVAALRYPASAFIADGSAVAVHLDTRLHA
jgi:hypothetical protein